MSEYLFFASAAAIVGAITGSFLNALLYRFNTGRGMGGRSRCMHCRHELSALDLIPLLSYLFLQGRCRYCRAKISPQYPLVELAMAGFALLTYFKYGVSIEFVLWFLIWAVLLFIVVYDLRHTIIPWTFSIFLLALALVHVWSLEFDIWNIAAGPLLALPLFLLSLISGGRWMGWGDSLLELSLGLLLGLSVGATALMLAFWAGALIGLLLILLSRWKALQNRFTIQSEIPFAPFLVLGAGIAHFLHVDFFSALTLFWY